MASTQVTPTRMELTRLKKKLVTAVKGHKLLKDKRDELMRQFLDLVRENMALRQKVEAGILSANKNFVIARAGMSEQILNTALMAPKQEVFLEADKRNVMSVDIPVFKTSTRTADANDIYSYGFAFTSGDLDGAVKSLADILPDMLKLAEVEKSCQLMASEIEKTRRRVNALEHVIIPETQQNIKYIGPYDIAHSQIILPLCGGNHRSYKLRKGGTDRHDGQTNECLAHAEGCGNLTCAVNHQLSAYDDHGNTQNRIYNTPYRTELFADILLLRPDGAGLQC